MKKIKTFIMMTFGVMLLAITACSDDDKEMLINESQLPASSVAFVKTHFPDVKITRIETDKGKTEYEVYLANGFEITFNEAGEWTDVDAPYGRTIPTGIAPLSIVSYVDSYYPAQGINEISRQTWGYEVELTDGLDLEFDSEGNFLRIDR